RCRRLHQNRRGDVAQQGTQIVQPVVTGDREVRRHPAIVAARDGPDMMVGVDLSHSGVGALSGSKPARRNSTQRAPGISACMRAAFCCTSAVVRGPGMTAVTTGWAAQNCSAAALTS